MDDAVDGIERVGQRKVADAPVGDRGAARKHRIVERTVDGRGELGPSRSADITKEALQDGEVGVTHRTERDGLIVQGDAAADGEPRVLADKLEVPDLDDVPIEREAD